MVPFCRTLDEADRVLEAMAGNGLLRGQAGLQVYVMAGIPSNIILAAEFGRDSRPGTAHAGAETRRRSRQPVLDDNVASLKYATDLDDGRRLCARRPAQFFAAPPPDGG